MYVSIPPWFLTWITFNGSSSDCQGVQHGLRRWHSKFEACGCWMGSRPVRCSSAVSQYKELNGSQPGSCPLWKVTMPYRIWLVRSKVRKTNIFIWYPTYRPLTAFERKFGRAILSMLWQPTPSPILCMLVSRCMLVIWRQPAIAGDGSLDSMTSITCCSIQFPH